MNLYIWLSRYENDVVLFEQIIIIVNYKKIKFILFTYISKLQEICIKNRHLYSIGYANCNPYTDLSCKNQNQWNKIFKK